MESLPKTPIAITQRQHENVATPVTVFPIANVQTRKHEGAQVDSDVIPVEISPHMLEAEDGTVVAVEWGRVLVPENRTNPDSDLIEIPFIRFKSVPGAHGIPTFFLNGGPGKLTLDNVHEFLPFLSDSASRPFDFVLVEQRGVGHSRPRLDCPGVYDLPSSHLSGIVAS